MSFLSDWLEIEPDWIDYNDHLNMGYYPVLFDRACDQVYPLLGFGPDYLQEHGHTTYTAEFHIRYLRELKLGDKIRSNFTLIQHDEKRFHSFQELIHEDGWIAATGEGMTLHVDISGPKVAPMPDKILRNFAKIQSEHDALPRPDGVGRKIGFT